MLRSPRDTFSSESAFPTKISIVAFGKSSRKTAGCSANLITFDNSVDRLLQFEITSNYIDFDGIKDGKGLKLEYMQQQSIQDLSYLIESTALLPFTRKGTITIKGDRRIKRGMNIRLTSTGELFYVDAVSQTAQFDESTNDRATILTVCRGIVEKHKELYFNIIDTDKSSEQRSLDKFHVNKDIFNFLLKRRQLV